MKKIPAAHNSQMAYLILGNAIEFGPFTKKVFSAIQQRLGFRADGSTIMYCQATPDYPAQPGSFFIFTESADES